MCSARQCLQTRVLVVVRLIVGMLTALTKYTRHSKALAKCTMSLKTLQLGICSKRHLPLSMLIEHMCGVVFCKALIRSWFCYKCCLANAHRFKFMLHMFVGSHATGRGALQLAKSCDACMPFLPCCPCHRLPSAISARLSRFFVADRVRGERFTCKLAAVCLPCKWPGKDLR